MRRLEPRIVFDGAALATAADAGSTPDSNQDTSSQAGSSDAAHSGNAQQDAHVATDNQSHSDNNASHIDTDAPYELSPAAKTEIVFVDGRIEDADSLMDGLSDNAQVYVLDPAGDGLAQISEILSQYSGLTAIHIFSHGDEGRLFLGNGELSSANIGDNADVVAGWGTSLSESGDILLWGCDVAAGADGAHFVSELATLTGADVAASVDSTGATSLGGNWTLEASSGSVESGSPFGLSSLMTYAHLLNTAPQITTGSAVTVNEDTSFTFNGANQVSLSDIDNDTLSMTLSVSHGTITLAGTSGLTGLSGNGSASITFSGSAADITTAMNGMTYQGTANYNGADSLSIQANDGTVTSSSSVGITVSAVEDAPQLAHNSMTVTEGNTPSAVTLQTSDLQVTDAESSASALTYSLVSLPSDGTLRINGAVATTASTFTQADIDAGRVTYTHNGAENATDSFVFNVTDGAGQTLGNTTFTINVTPVDDAPVQTTVDNGAITEGGALTLSQSNLDFSDVDTSNSNIRYTVTAASLSEGTLTVNGSSIGVGGQFTQADINGGLVVYTHNGAEPSATQSFSFSVTDGTTTSTGSITIAVTPVNDNPVVAVNALTVAEGGSASFSTANLNITDPDNTTEQIIYKIASLPANGTLTFNGNAVVVGTTFSQADIAKLSYTHNGGETTSDSFTFTARDGAGGSISTTTATITVTPVNDQVGASGSATIFEGESGNVSITITDADDAAANISVTFNSLPSHGTLSFNGSAVTTGQTITKAALDAGTLSFAHDGSDNTPEDTSFSITVTDSGGGTGTASTVTKTITIDVVPVDDDPTLPTNTGATVAEGGTLTVLNTQLKATDVDSPDSTLTYQVESLTSSGILMLGSVQLGVGSTFTQADIDAGNVKYVNQSETAGSDSFTFTLRDGQVNIRTGNPGQLSSTPGTPAVQTFNITITEVPDAPTLTANAAQEIPQGGTVTITASALNASDVDSSDANIIFTVTSVPANGDVKLNGNTLSANDTFTLADVKNGLVTYVHSSAQPIGSDSFQFTLTDSTGTPSSPSTQTHSFFVTSAPTAPDNTGPGTSVPTQSANTGITVQEHGTVSLASALEYSDNVAASSLIYTITTDAQYGQVLLNGVQLGVGSQFTQADIDNGLVTFKSDGTNDTAATQTDQDSFVLRLIDGEGATVTGITVAVTITPVNDAPTVSAPSTATTNEDTSVAISGVSIADVDEDATTNAQLKITLTAANGTLTLSTLTGLTFTTGDGTSDGTMTFTGSRAAINTALATLSYQGNANFNGSDTITITANDQGNTGVDPSTVSGMSATGDASSEEGSATVTVTVRSINDGPSVGTNTGMTGTEGGTTTITSAMLSGTDVDNSADEIYYVITTATADGTIKLNGTALAIGGYFTQDDINNNRVTYVHNGTENFRDSFTFTLSDGSSTSSAGNVFNINITPVNDAPSVSTNSTLALSEGATATITASHLAVSDPDGSSEISLAADTLTFTITSGPSHGTILLDGVAYAGQALTNAMIAANRITYRHDGTENFTDSMVVTVDDNTGGANDTATATFNFKIAPLNDDPTVGNNVTLTVNEGGSGTITSTLLSAVDPDNNVRQVQFRITSGVSTGTLFLDGKAIGVGTAFTLEDIQNGKLSYTHNGEEVYTDSFNFTIEDGGGGSATGTYNIVVNPINDTPTITVPGSKSVDEDTNLTITGISIADKDANSGSGNSTPSLGPGDNIVSATLSVSNGAITLAQTTGLTFSTGDGTSDATMTFTGSLANVNAAIATLTYRGATNFNGSDTLTISFSDRGNYGADPGTSGTATDESASSTIAITVNPINDAPTVTPPAAQTVTEDTTLTLSSGNGNAIVIGDVDADVTSGDTLTVTISATHGTLTLGGTTGLTGVSGNGTKTVTFTGSRAEVNTAIDGLVYDSDNDYAGSDTINVSVNDNGNTGSGGAKTGTGSVAVTVDAVNDRPDITAPSSTQTAPEDTVLTFNSANSNLVQITDVDAASGSITVTLSLSGATPGGLTLSQTTGLSFSTGDGTSDATMTFSGTLANVNAALNGMTYQGPSNVNGFTTTLSITVNDNGNTGSDPGTSGGPSDETRSASFDISVPSVNDKPTVSGPSAQTATEDDPAGVTFGNISFADVDADAANDVMTVTLSVAHGKITLDAAAISAAASVSNNGTATVTLTGTLNQLNSALNAASRITYVSDANYNGSDPMTVSINDGGKSGNDPSVYGLTNTGDNSSEVGTGTVSITVNPVNDAPTITVPSAQTVNEDTNLVFSSGNGNQIQIADIDSASSNVTVTLTTSHGNLTANGSTSGLTVSGQGSHALTLTGTVAKINTAIATLTYRGDANYNSNVAATDTISINVNDNGNTGADPSTVGQADTGTSTNEQANASISVTVTPINDTPTVTVPGLQTAASAAGVTFSSGNGNQISVADIDVNETDSNATVRITLSVTTGTLTLSGTTGLSFTTGDGTSDTTMTFTGKVSDVNTALNGLVFLPGGDQNSTATLSLTVNDQGNTGTDPGLTADGSSEAATGTVTIRMSEINDAPTITAPSSSVTGTEDSTVTFTGGNQIQIGDVDAFAGQLKVTLSVSNGKLTMSTLTGLTFTTGDGTSDATMVFTGTLTNINNALATLSYLGNTGYNSGQGTETLNITVNDQGNTGVDPGLTGDATSEEATKAVGISIQAINDTPTVTVPGAQTVNEDTNLSITGISVADVDIAETPGGQVRLTVAANNGVLTLAQTTGLTFSTGDGTSDATMTFTGTVANVNSALATLTYRGNGNFNGSDTITVTVNDQGNTGNDPGLTGDASSEQASATIAVTVSPINDTPTITAPATATVNEDTNLVFSSGNGNQISFADVDAASGTVTATLSVSHGAITLGQTTGLSFSTGDGTSDAAMTFSGTLANVNAAIASLTYRGTANYHGSDTLSLTINDGGNTGTDPGLTGTATTEQASTTVAITVSPVNDAPTISTPVSVTTPEDTQVTVNLTTNASDVDGGTGTGDAGIASYTVQSLPSASAGILYLSDGTTAVTTSMTLTPAQAASLVFKPATNFNGGPVNFTYVVTDSDGASSSAATGAITVTPVNDTPTITVPSAQTVNEDTDLTITGVSFADVDAGTGTVTATLSVSKGVLTLGQTTGLSFSTGDGTSDASMTFSGTLANVNAAIASLTYRGNSNFHGSDTLNLTINDGGNTGADPGLTGTATTEQATGTLAITVSPVNDAPTISSPISVTTPEDTQVTVNLTTNASDVDGGTGTNDGAITSYTVQTLPSASMGTLFLSDGTTAVTAGTQLTPAQAAGLIFKPAANYNGGPVNFTYFATDAGSADSSVVTGSITVTPVNDTPTITVPAAQTVNEDTDLTITGVSFADVDASTGTMTATLSVSHGTITLAQTTGLSFTTGDGTSDASMTFSGTLANVNAAIASLTYRGSANYHGPDTLSLTINDGGNTGADPGLTGTATTEQATSTVAITINPVNDPPVANPFNTTTPENTTVTVSLTATDPDGGTNSTTDAGVSFLTVTSLPSASEGRLTLSDGSTNVTVGMNLTPAQANSLKFIPAHDYNGTVTFNFTATDTAGTVSSSATATVIISSTNSTPSVSKSSATVYEGLSVTFDANSLLVSDADNTAAQLTYTVNSLTSNGTLYKNGVALTAGQTFTQADIANGLIKYTHDGTETTSDSFSVTAVDPGALSTGAFTVSITVNPVNDAPSVSVPGAQTTAEDTALSITGVSVADVDAGTGNIQVTVSSPNGSFSVTTTTGLASATTASNGNLTLTGTVANINTALATLRYIPNQDYNGSDTITVTVNDLGRTGADPSSVGLTGTGTASNEQASATIGVTVTAVNDIPVPITTPGQPDVTINPGEPFTGFITDYFTDPDGGPYTFGVATPPTNGTLTIVDPATGKFVYTPNPNFEGIDTFTFSVDGASIPFPQTILVNVTIRVQNLNISFIDPTRFDPIGNARRVDAADAGVEIGRNGLNLDLNPRQIGVYEANQNLQFNNEYIRAVVEDQLGAIDVQYGVGAASEALRGAVETNQNTPQNPNATIVEVNLQTSSGSSSRSSGQFLSLGTLETAAGGQQQPGQPAPDEEETNAANPEDTTAGETGADTSDADTAETGEPTDDASEEILNASPQPNPANPPAPQQGQSPNNGDQRQPGQQGEIPDTDVPGQQGYFMQDGDAGNGVFAYAYPARFTDQLAAEAGRMEEETMSLLAALTDVIARGNHTTTNL